MWRKNRLKRRRDVPSSQLFATGVRLHRAAVVKELSDVCARLTGEQIRQRTGRCCAAELRCKSRDVHRLHADHEVVQRLLFSRSLINLASGVDVTQSPCAAMTSRFVIMTSPPPPAAVAAWQ